MDAPSSWVQRWAHLICPQGTVLDIARGHGRHMQFLAAQGHQVLGLDRSPEALSAAAAWGEVRQADIENAPWPLMQNSQPRQFDAVVVTNYLWRALFPVMLSSLASGGVLIYETFAVGNETVGKPSRPDFLLQPGELLSAFPGLRVVAYELLAGANHSPAHSPARYPL
jgi:cyclopropane fatty-acyl-phospholipid synthase-like methyltransferase